MRVDYFVYFILRFDRYQDETQPQLWPTLPLNPNRND